jgi:hypothetical protein
VCEVHGRTSGSVLGNAAEDAIVLLARLGVKDIKVLRPQPGFGAGFVRLSKGLQGRFMVEVSPPLPSAPWN